ncbi:hypothetical protein [Eubacterium sp.]
MPFCPKCKYEFVDGIKKCNECGCDLVDSLDDITNESDEEIMDNENIINTELEDGNLGETYESLEDGNVPFDKEDEENRFMSSAKTYQKLSDKYEDVKSSAYTLILVGGVGLFVMILQWINVIKFPISSQTKWLFNSVLGGMFIIFLAAGIVSFMHAKKVKIEADIEDELINKINQFAKENITKEIIDKEVPQDDSVEILFFNRAEVIKSILMHEFEDADEALIDELIENIYQSIYEE